MSIGRPQTPLLLFCEGCYLGGETLNILIVPDVEVPVHVYRGGVAHVGSSIVGSRVCGSSILLRFVAVHRSGGYARECYASIRGQ